MIWKSACHGELKATREKNILVIEGNGPWNIETLQVVGKTIKNELESLYQHPWGVLSIMHGEAAYLPDAVAHLKDTITREKKSNRIATALVITQTNLPTFSKGHLSQIYDSAGETYQFFEDAEKARAWLTEQIEQATKQQNQDTP